MDEEGERGPQGDDARDGADLVPVAHDDRAQDLAAQLELEAHGETLRECELGLWRASQVQVEAANARENDDSDADEFKQQDGDLDDVLHIEVERAHDQLKHTASLRLTTRLARTR